jgi:hypothetical protein
MFLKITLSAHTFSLDLVEDPLTFSSTPMPLFIVIIHWIWIDELEVQQLLHQPFP